MHGRAQDYDSAELNLGIILAERQDRNSRRPYASTSLRPPKGIATRNTIWECTTPRVAEFGRDPRRPSGGISGGVPPGRRRGSELRGLLPSRRRRRHPNSERVRALVSQSISRRATCLRSATSAFATSSVTASPKVFPSPGIISAPQPQPDIRAQDVDSNHVPLDSHGSDKRRNKTPTLVRPSPSKATSTNQSADSRSGIEQFGSPAALPSPSLPAMGMVG